MDKKQISINSGVSDERLDKLKGLQDDGQEHISCVDCGRNLLVIQKASPRQYIGRVTTKILAKCGFCGGHSFVREIEGNFYPGAPNDDMIIDNICPWEGCPEADVIFEAKAKN